MLYYTISQGWEFAAMALCGAAMGAAALLFGGARRVMCVRLWGCLLCDALMGLVWAAIAAVALVAAARGQARAYHFLAMALGGALFMISVSPAARAVASHLGRAALHIGHFLAHCRATKWIFK